MTTKFCRRCDMPREVDDTGQSVHCQALDCLIGNAPARAKWKDPTATLTCDLDPDCHDQGCTERPTDCQRLRDTRAGIDRRHDRVVVTSNPTGFRSWVRRLFREGT